MCSSDWRAHGTGGPSLCPHQRGIDERAANEIGGPLCRAFDSAAYFWPILPAERFLMGRTVFLHPIVWGVHLSFFDVSLLQLQRAARSSRRPKQNYAKIAARSAFWNSLRVTRVLMSMGCRRVGLCLWPRHGPAVTPALFRPVYLAHRHDSRLGPCRRLSRPRTSSHWTPNMAS